ncbi:MAG: outer rane efflux protein, partial [Geminicoccaceae bacterium]|nr:outer rane efflux protein [Geminicoccaceae bacterium]
MSRRGYCLSLFLCTALSAAGAQGRPGLSPSDTLRLGIEAAVTMAIRQGDETRLAAAQVDVTEAQITTARAAGLPQLRLNGTYTQVIENARANIVGSVFGQSFTYNTNVNVSQALFQGGRIFAGARAAANARRSARFDQTEVRARVAVDI